VVTSSRLYTQYSNVVLLTIMLLIVSLSKFVELKKKPKTPTVLFWLSKVGVVILMTGQLNLLLNGSTRLKFVSN
jgi:hypothetical protein